MKKHSKSIGTSMIDKKEIDDLIFWLSYDLCYSCDRSSQRNAAIKMIVKLYKELQIVYPVLCNLNYR